MKKALLLLALGVLWTSVHAGESVALPDPQKSGGVSVLEAIDRRGSPAGAEFPMGDLSDLDLSTILWAATGHNREGRLWTVPMANGREPYSTIYVLRRDGAYRFDWRDNTLKQVSGEDLTKVVPMQPFAQNAPVTLVIAADGVELAKIASPLAEEFAAVLAGAMSQNVYLAADAVGVGARVIYSIKRDEAAKALDLDADDAPLFGIVLGKK